MHQQHVLRGDRGAVHFDWSVILSFGSGLDLVVIVYLCGHYWLCCGLCPSESFVLGRFPIHP